MRAARWIALVTAVCALGAGLFGGRAEATNFGSVDMSWKTLPLINMTLTPNYQSGYGPIGGAGSGSTPSPGPSAAPSSGWIDFGNIVAGYNYLYKYAVQASVMTNDSSGFSVYAEGSASIVNETDSTIYPINQTLFWLVSSSSNNPFSVANAFQQTAGTVTGCGPSLGPCSIAYTSYPAAIWSYPSETIGDPGNIVSKGYDYEVRLPETATLGNYYVWIIYTAVGN